ncbi:hypothetical protein HIM_11554 [Hirsutella minnesotensis 3608]|uniref:DUF6570 domain-containing protein n=1 Tax=Hirsutella minnesotensis 3608 TaxID=1043627 RepID=A0A0F7ZR62_9HYPO|nr:hypothetical protein HIM_11554 [Hirsutella minnesotensis 3608]
MAAAGRAQRRAGLGEKPAQTEGNPGPSGSRGRRTVAAPNGKFGRTTGQSAAARAEGRRSSTAVERGRSAAGSQHVPRAIQARPASGAEAHATTPIAARPLGSGRDDATAGRAAARRQAREEQKRKRDPSSGQAGRKQARVGGKTPRSQRMQAEDLADVLRHLEDEFEAGERLADEQGWCAPVPRERQHAYPDELKDLTPVEEKLISLNSCYGFVTKYSTPGGQRQSVRYPRHVKGHITVFPNDVQGLAAKVLPHPLLRVMDEIHVAGRREAQAAGPGNNPLYGEVEIDAAEMDGWGAPPHGVPAVVCERLERNEPSARERTRTAQVVPPSERAMDEAGAAEIEEILAALRQGRDPAEGSRDVTRTCEDADREGEGEGEGARPEEGGDIINEVTSSGMFPLDGAPEVADAEKIRFARNAVGPQGARAGPRMWVGTAAGGPGGGDDAEPYIQVRRGDDFADSADASFFAKAFPTLFPFGVGGPRLVDEDATGGSAAAGVGNRASEAERAAEGLTSTRNMTLQAWADVVLRRHGGRFLKAT